MKACTRCGVVKPLLDYSPSPRMADGHHSHCKTCQAERSKRWRRENRDKQREQSRRKYERLGNAHHAQRVATWRASNPAHNRLIGNAQQAVHRAVRDGSLVRPAVCERCGDGGPIEAHHEDHSKKLEVVWLCRACHGLTKRAEAA